MKGNLPVPAGPVAGLSWLWWTGPPAVITWAYREVLPPRVRGWWNPRGTANSHLALRAILAGGRRGGWCAFFRFAMPQFKQGIPWWLDPDG